MTVLCFVTVLEKGTEQMKSKIANLTLLAILTITSFLIVQNVSSIRSTYLHVWGNPIHCLALLLFGGAVSTKVIFLLHPLWINENRRAICNGRFEDTALSRNLAIATTWLLCATIMAFNLWLYINQ